MKTTKLIAILASVAIGSLLAHAQGTFINLDFESADLSPVPPNQGGVQVPVGSALPGWTAYIGTDQQSQVTQNDYGHGLAQIDVFGPNYPAAGWPPSPDNPGVIDGNYSVLVQSGFLSDGITPENVSIAQTGTVPIGYQSLEFKAWPTFANEFSVSFNGNNLSPVMLGTGPNYILYGVDISPYAGQTGQLEFTADFVTPGASWLGLDDIAFSPSAVPEPSPLVLTGIGGLLIGLYRRFARGRR
jgi:hypothetical protein